MAHSGGVRKKKRKDVLFSKTVILLKNDDQAYKSFSELSRIRSTSQQYKKGIEFASWMTEDDVTKKIKETFPYLENKRFSCAAVVKLDNDHKKYEFHGSPRVWNGETIKKKIMGNSSLYILEEKVSQQTSTVTNNGSNSTDLNPSTSAHNLIPQVSGQSNTISAPLVSSQLHSYQVTKEVSQPTTCAVTHNSILTADSKPSTCIHSVHPTGGQTCTINTPLDSNQANLYQQLDQLSSEIQMSHLGDQSPMEVDDDNQQGVSGYNCTGSHGILPTYGALYSMQNPVFLITQTSFEQNHSSVLSLGEVVTATSQQGLNFIPASSTDKTDVTVAAAYGAQVEVQSGKYSSSSDDTFPTSGISEGDFVLSEDDLSQNHWRREANVQFQVSITPNRVPLKGGELCNFTFTPMLPTNVLSGSAEFVHLETVGVKRFEDDSMIGKKIPSSPEPGWVTVVLKSQYGFKLGETSIEYVDEEKEFLQRVVQEPKLQCRLFSEWSTMLGDNLEPKKTETQSSGNLGFTQMQQVQVLRLLVYAAAETGAQQFIQMIFNSSAGRVVFDAYKDSSPLPQFIARKHGHNETSQYLEGMTTRFSKEIKIFPERSQTIDWAELVAAAEAAQEQHELSIASREENHQVESDETIDTGYFGDAETSSSDSSQLSRSDFVDDDSEMSFEEKKNELHYCLNKGLNECDKGITKEQTSQLNFNRPITSLSGQMMCFVFPRKQANVKGRQETKQCILEEIGAFHISNHYTKEVHILQELKRFQHAGISVHLSGATKCIPCYLSTMYERWRVQLQFVRDSEERTMQWSSVLFHKMHLDPAEGFLSISLTLPAVMVERNFVRGDGNLSIMGPLQQVDCRPVDGAANVESSFVDSGLPAPGPNDEDSPVRWTASDYSVEHCHSTASECWVLTSTYRPTKKILFVHVADRKDHFHPESWFEDEDCELMIQCWKWQWCKKKRDMQEQSGLTLSTSAQSLPQTGEQSNTISASLSGKQVFSYEDISKAKPVKFCFTASNSSTEPSEKGEKPLAQHMARYSGTWFGQKEDGVIRTSESKEAVKINDNDDDDDDDGYDDDGYDDDYDYDDDQDKPSTEVSDVNSSKFEATVEQVLEWKAFNDDEDEQVRLGDCSITKLDTLQKKTEEKQMSPVEEKITSEEEPATNPTESSSPVYEVSNEMKCKIEKATRARLYLLQQTGPNTFLIGEDSPDHKFRVMIGPQSCTCTRTHCVHLLFVMLRVFKLKENDPLLWSLKLKNFEVENLLSKFHAHVKSRLTKDASDLKNSRSKGHETFPSRTPETSSTGGLIPHPSDGGEMCPICLLEMMEGESLMSCRDGCNNRLHQHCMEIWAAERKRQREALFCPLCRKIWSSEVYGTERSPGHSLRSDLPSVPAPLGPEEITLPHSGQIPASQVKLAKPWIEAFREKDACANDETDKMSESELLHSIVDTLTIPLSLLLSPCYSPSKEIYLAWFRFLVESWRQVPVKLAVGKKCQEIIEQEEAEAVAKAMAVSTHYTGPSKIESLDTGDGMIVIFAQPEDLEKAIDSKHLYMEGVHWKKGELLGSGAYSTCYAVRDLKNGSLMAVKQVSFCRNSTKKQDIVMKTIENEISLLGRLQHPHLIKCLGATKHTAHFNIFLEWMPGGSITNLLSKYGAFDERVVIAYTKQILQGVAYLHQNQIIHRDIKGGNILVDSTGQNVKIADFGAAARLATQLTGAGEFQGQLVGTIAFMAPEMLRGESYGRSCDVWSLGCAIIEMATGKPPWNAHEHSNHLALIFKIACCERPPNIPENLKPALRDVLLRCLEVTPEERSSAMDLLRHPLFTQM